jgi:hypothetical protein
MKNYKLTKNPLTNELSAYAIELIDGIPTGVNVNIKTNDDYLKWLEEGNEPLPPDPIPEPEPLTPQQKLEAAGLSIEELKELLGLDT